MAFYDTTATYDSGLYYDDPTPTTSHRMAQIKLDFKNKKSEDILGLSTEIILAMTGNANFATPNPTLVALTALRDGLQSKINDVKTKENIWRAAIVARDAQEDATIAAFTLLSAYVQNASGGDEAKILSSGFQVRATPGASQPVVAPGNLRASAGDHEGEIDLMWDPVSGASSYNVECREDGTSVWQPVKTVTKSRLTVSDLTPGKLYAFRTRAVGPTGEGPWSDDAQKRAS